MSRLIALALSQRLLTSLLALVLLLSGLWAFQGLPIDAFPDVSSTQVKIILKAPGMTPSEVESRVTRIVEQEMLGIPHQAVLRSQSKYAIADITIDFDEGTDIYWARQQVSERLGSVLAGMPSDITGGMAPITTPLGEMFMFTVEGPQSLAERRSVLDWVIRPQLRNIVGVADVNSLGGYVRSYVVSPDFEKLSAFGIGIDELKMAIEQNNQNDGAGRVDKGEEALLVRSEGRIQSPEDLRSIVIKGRGAQLVRVGDVAKVSIEGLTRYGAVTQNGKQETVEGLVLGLRGANARLLVDQVSKRLDEIAKTLPAGMTIKPFYNRGTLVGKAVHTVTKALYEAIVLVLILLVVFLGNLRAALAVAVILPLSALGTFLLMRWVGLSANLMSLGGLAIAIGMLVDAAVVVVENIEARQGGSKHAGFLNAIYEATREVAVPITSGILIIMTVFLPLLTLEGLEGKMFAPVALTIVFALGCSLLLSLTVIPALASMLLKQGHHQSPRFVLWLERHYSHFLKSALAHPRQIYAVALVLLAGAIGAVSFVGKSFIPTLDEGDIIMQVEKLPSISLAESSAIDLRIQQAVMNAVPEVERIVARVGSDELGLDPMGLNETDTFVVLKPTDQWRFKSKDELIEAIRKAAGDIPGVNIGFTQPIEMRTSEMLSGVRGDLAVKIYGPDLQTLNQLAEQTLKMLENVPGSQDVLTSQADGVQYLQVSLNHDVMGAMGLSTLEVQSMLRQMVEGMPISEVQELERRTPLLIRADKSSLQSLAQLRLPTRTGQMVPLSSIATLTEQAGPVRIDRENASRMTVVRANVNGRDLVGFVDEAKKNFAQQIKLPPGYRVSWGGQFENQQRAAKRLLTVIPIALGLIVLILFFTLGNVRQAVLVVCNIPFAMVGGVFALLVSGQYLSVPAAVGFIALMGIAVLNGLVLLTEFNNLLNAGNTLQRTVHLGSVRRLRPVLMTASIAALGLIPLLFATGPGSEVQKPLAIVVIGGLVTATALTLLVMPALFQRFGVSAKQRLEIEQ
ncbi:MAG TPA: CusA/CzcA family heavy metal efflux RND transporter [Limnobacter sp.]|uniref:efflux RND transporter permease subunit n=1 Tax=Limnobacter sp. TaxID=2003368 RepID=UPI002E33E9C0|nr:CusA/CzcA family heavy metal efflux RND transporter [Limnobacter sp.]HEX5485542.1 CusA/CzcA family heavy metal efflux RND transporter [Limnobacter sp.]